MIFSASIYSCRLRASHGLLFLFVCFFFFSSCSKSADQDSGVAALNVSLEDLALDVESTLDLASASQQAVSTITAQEVSVPLNNALTMVATLTPVVRSASLKNKLSASTKSMTTTTNSEVLETGVQYRLVVYDANNNYVTDKVYTKGSDNNDVFYLDVGKTYTFVSYSINSKTTVPAIDSSKKLNDATLSNVDGNGYFMYFKKSIALVKGENYLGIRLKHLFSEITTTLDASALTGNIVSCSANVSPHYAAVTVNLTGGTLAGAGNVTTKNMSFGTFGGKTVTSTATKIAQPGTTTGAITLLSIQVGTITRSNLVLNNLTISPGVRYTLTLKLQASGTNGIDVGGYLWAPGNLRYSNGVYSFGADQSVFGDFWQLNALLPYGSGTGKYEYNSATDPCTKVTSNGGGWRTPSKSEMASATGENGSKPIFNITYTPTTSRATYKGVRGTFIGTNTQPSAADIDKYIFLPMTGNPWGSNETSYWTYTKDNGNNVRFNFNNESISYYNGQYFTYPGNIRCVKNK